MGYKVTKAVERNATFQTFEDLQVYQTARELRREMYGVARKLPEFEKFGLTSQVRRAAVSLTNNMAEGHGRYHYPDQIRFFLHSRGSLEELMDDLNVCLDESYLPESEVVRLKQLAHTVLALINGYIRHLRSRSASVREEDEMEAALHALPL
jgi:four helix bundle protein